MAIAVYGIRNCTTMQKARAWLEAHGVEYRFHDYKTAGLERATLQGWCGRLGWEALLNRAGQTFRKLPEAEREGITEARAMALMLRQPSMIRRPVLEFADGRLLVGFRPETYEAAFRGS